VVRLVVDVDAHDVADAELRSHTGQRPDVLEPYGLVVGLDAGDGGRVVGRRAGGVLAFEVVVLAGGVGPRRAWLGGARPPGHVVGAGVDVEEDLDADVVQAPDDRLQRRPSALDANGLIVLQNGIDPLRVAGSVRQGLVDERQPDQVNAHGRYLLRILRVG